MKGNIFNNTNGSSNGIILLAIASIGSVLLAFSTISPKIYSQNFFKTNAINIQVIQNTIKNTILNNESWIATTSDPANIASSNMNCLTDPSISCSFPTLANLKMVFTLKDSSGQILTENNLGFTPEGEPCDTFDLNLGNDECPFQYQLTWTPLCSLAQPCTTPRSQIDGTLIVKFKNNKVIINPAKYPIKFIR